MPSPELPFSLPDPGTLGNSGLGRVVQRLTQTLTRDALVQATLEHLRESFHVDRVVLYYFYSRWRGQVTSESWVTPSLSILGSTGADDCFNDTYAEQYLQGRVRAIADVTSANLDPCHLSFLQSISVQANLVVPVLVHHQLWGLLVAHHCRSSRPWQPGDIDEIRAAALTLAQSPAIESSLLPPDL
ncbi:GAF domain-containing protein [Leptolyngbya sp. PCC 6406]|uniref:GAF domain-containing protein n=1 Tax=Leptolyngbya sp. PCC 6406 TaxID=1173264 RepID=UPI0002AD14C7|nr:GAF domain-containing protein [Leptolyngbya sp. PCC 6406]